MSVASVASPDARAKRNTEPGNPQGRKASGRARRLWMALAIAASGYACYVATALVYRTAFAVDPKLPPALALTRTSWDLGRVPVGKTIQVAFPVNNSGGKRLLVNRAGQSCECVSSAGEHLAISPGRTEDLTAVLDTAKVSGPVKLELSYGTNDPEHRHLTLVLLADVY